MMVSLTKCRNHCKADIQYYLMDTSLHDGHTKWTRRYTVPFELHCPLQERISLTSPEECLGSQPSLEGNRLQSIGKGVVDTQGNDPQHNTLPTQAATRDIECT